MLNNLSTANKFALVTSLLKGAAPELLVNAEINELRHAAFRSANPRTVPAWMKLTQDQKVELAMRSIINRYNHQ